MTMASRRASWSYSFPVFLISVLTSSADDVEYRLIRDLTRHYDPRIRPSLNASEPLNVTFGLALSQIIDVDEKNQIITTNCWLNQVWIDYKLRWDPSKYGNIKVVRLPYESIWKPDILLYNNADVSSYKSSISTNVIVTSDGNVTWLSMVIFRSSCAVDVKYFPFDEQNCTMQFASWTYDGYQLNLIKVGEDGDTSNYIQNSEWTLMKLHAVRKIVYYSCCAEPYPDVTYTIQIKRKPLFYVFNMILPCLLITLVALLGFYIPSDSGEKVTMGITTLLSMTVFLMLVAENMPPTSDVLPLVGLYYGITIAIVSLATAMTAFTLNIHHKGTSGRCVPRIVRIICFKFLARILCIRLSPPPEVKSASHLLSNSGVKRNTTAYVKMNRMVKLSKRFLANSGSPVTAVEFTVPVRVDSSDVSLNEERSPAAENGAKPSVRLPQQQQQRIQSNPASPLPPLLGPVPPPPNPSGSCGVPPQPQPQPQSQPKQDLGPASAFERQFLRTLDKVYQTIEKNEFRLAELDRREAAKHDWQQVALVVDRLLMLVFIVATLGITAAILFHAPHSREFLFGGLLGHGSPGGPSTPAAAAAEAAGDNASSSPSSSSLAVGPTDSPPPVAASK